MERKPLSCTAKPVNLAGHAPELPSDPAPNIEERPARTSAGNSANDLGGEPRGPNDVLSSHNAVILVSAKAGRRVAMELSASAERVSAPNSVSANRRSISCCNRASASQAAHGGAMGEEQQNWALTCMRLEARTTAGAQTPSEAKPRRNRRRGTTREPIARNPRALADEYASAIAFRQR
jgi:hypothetical protein